MKLTLNTCPAEADAISDLLWEDMVPAEYACEDVDDLGGVGTTMVRHEDWLIMGLTGATTSEVFG